MVLKFIGMGRKYCNSVDYGVSYHIVCCCLMAVSLGVDKVQLFDFVVILVI
jgi:hypothetical protein